MQRNQKIVYRWLLALAGALLVCFAALVSNAEIERALLGDASRTLAWGPTLFRALLAAHGLLLAFTGIVWMGKGTTSRVGAATPVPGDAAGNQRPEGGWNWIALGALSIVALGLRLWRLDTDLWVDEVLTLLDFVRRPLGEIVASFPSQNQHMLFSILAHESVRLFGQSAWALRLPSVLFGVASLWALFLLGRRVLGAREALLACALMTVSYHHIWFSQNARGYMGLLFFTLLATWLWLEATDRGAARWWIAYAAAATLGMWVHMTMAFVIAAHFLVYLFTLVSTAVRRRSNAGGDERSVPSDHGLRSWWRPLVAWALCASVTLQLYALALPEFLRTGLHEESLPSEWTSPWWVIAESLRSLRVGFAGAAVVVAGGAMLCAGWLSILRRDRQAGLLIALPALLAGSTMLALGHNLWPRFFFFSMGFALLIVVHGATAFARWTCDQLLVVKPRTPARRLGAWAGVGLVCLMIAASAVTVPRYYTLPKQDFSGARDYVERHREPGDAVVAVGLAGIVYGRYLTPRQWSVAETEGELEGFVRANHNNVWLVYTLPTEVRVYRPRIWQTIERGFEVVKVFPGTLGGGEVYVCRQQHAKVTQNASSQRTLYARSNDVGQ